MDAEEQQCGGDDSTQKWEYGIGGRMRQPAEWTMPEAYGREAGHSMLRHATALSPAQSRGWPWKGGRIPMLHKPDRRSANTSSIPRYGVLARQPQSTAMPGRSAKLKKAAEREWSIDATGESQRISHVATERFAAIRVGVPLRISAMPTFGLEGPKLSPASGSKRKSFSPIPAPKNRIRW